MSILRATGWALLGFALFTVVAVLFPFAALYEVATRNAHRCFRKSRGRDPDLRAWLKAHDDAVEEYAEAFKKLADS